jgi:lipoic acid synthetase
MDSPRKPAWLKVRLGHGPTYAGIKSLMHEQNLHTVCEEALCPNQGTCWEHRRATIMILGDTCTRGCRFCNVTPGWSGVCDRDEPGRVAKAVAATGLRDVVITSVTRDDLPDGGAGLWAETVRSIRAQVPGIVIEVLIPDFGGNLEAVQTVLDAAPDVVGHNLETVPSLYATVRNKADYARSLRVLASSHEAGFITKTGIMVGLGEARSEILALLRDARAAGVDILYIGQYLQPSRRHLPVVRYVEPREFEELREAGRAEGFPVVVSGPLVRSSYHHADQERYVAEWRGAGGKP